ncbi:PH domain-containing protein [Leifsonia sp. H3M29-4]|uniref:PH domain-containing protein n=1 Tax=Salinibacterium metalliresistens TaxID=3031321 RepID=UPI0023DCD30D|nr:PH domain-containing protein [Salinibacterium metalliresistens]MDF1477486.1 PH domain-containing protein [Salinibacterium metalliresistens]
MTLHQGDASPATTEERQSIDIPAQWRRVSPKYVWVDLGGTLIGAVVALAATSVPVFVTGIAWFWALPASLAVVFIITLALTPRRVRAIGFQLREDDLLFRKGLMFQRFVAVPYGRMQLVDINRGPLDRAVGLSELKFVTAAAATNVVVPGLPEAEAEELRDRLVALAESRRAGL